jgi:RimJ/RimL family protein N-acetyltransferase
MTGWRPARSTSATTCSPPTGGHGYATRAVRLLLRHLAVRTDYTVASLLIDPGNARSLALAARIAGAVEAAHPRGRYFRVPLTAPAPPQSRAV